MIKGEETVKHLKDLRTRAKVALSRKVNSVTKTLNTMLEEELMKEYREVHKAATKVTEANSEYLMQIILNADSDEDQVPEELSADVEKTNGETSQRLEEVSEVIKANLWTRHGEKTVMFAIGEAEKVYEDAEATQIDLVSYENDEKQLKHLEILIKELKEVHSTWRGWAPVTARKDVEEIVRQLETRKNALKRQKEAEFNKARGAAELVRTAAEDERTKLAETQRAKLAEIQIAAEEARIAAEDERAQFALVQLRQDQAQRSKLAEAQIAAEEARFDLMKAQHKAVEEAGTEPRDNPMGAISKIRLKPVSLPKFSGSMREFHSWKKDWESLQKQGEPSGSPEVKKFQFLDSMEEKLS
ncbi:translation initiation factor IF-2-like [Gymnodraco acuticeps]|uniref:Translation initiation factor IF-2-like n=1 Tax=Gymnodraco acuticeps TaxID=8218 RepID=A0A6P8SZ97_GYMAC|nr:translation initiation factor IF-2-like [Gymnodraco acuticeps]